MLAAAVLRLSTSAARDDSLVISDQNCGQSTFAATATSGSDDEQRPDRGGDVDPARQPGRGVTDKTLVR